MPQERRNLYRILHVQPEAPQEVIKAAYRALMSTLRAHPDLGGDHEVAARLNAAYDVLGDPARRQQYDRSMRRPGRGVPGAEASATPARADPWSWLADRRCPFCQHRFALQGAPQAQCGHCGSPLRPAPVAERMAGEILGRRRGERFAREMDAAIRLPGQPADSPARVRDLSLSGLALVCTRRMPEGSAFRVTTSTFDAVAAVVACRPAGAAFTVHARLLTLQMTKAAARGVYVSAVA